MASAGDRLCSLSTSSAISANPNDHVSRNVRCNTPCDRPGRRLGNPPTARRRHNRGIARVATANALHYARDLSLPGSATTGQEPLRTYRATESGLMKGLWALLATPHWSLNIFRGDREAVRDPVRDQ